MIKLAFLYLDEKDYKKALECVEKRRKLKMKFTCGNEYDLVQRQLKYIEEQCVLGLKK